jgi:cytochrome c biogenesis protein CcmG/thiol:disulfide interchange protein DsbE
VLLQLANTGLVDIYGLNYKDERAKAQQWLQQLGDPYVANAFDADGRTGIDWGVYGAPETFIMDKQGMIRHKHIGPLTVDALNSTILPLIAELQATP